MDPDHFAILLVEDDEAQAFLVTRLLEGSTDAQIEVTHVTRLAEAFDAMALRQYDAILLDLGLPDAFGLQGVQRLSERPSEVPFLVLTASSEPAMARAAIKLGAADYLLKDSLDGTALPRTVIHAIERHRARLRRRQGEMHVRDIVAAMEDGVLVVDAVGQILFANGAAAALYGTTAEMMTGELFEHSLQSPGVRDVEIRGGRSKIAAQMRASPMTWRERRAWVVVLRAASPPATT